MLENLTTLILIGSYVGALFFAIAVTWFFRRVTVQPTAPLDRLTRAFLVGGPQRAREVAFFQIATESWVKPAGPGEFAPRVFAVDNDVVGLLPLEREMLTWATKQIKFSTQQILRRRYEKLKGVENQLVRNRLILSSKEFFEAKVVSLLPLGLLTVSVLIHVGMDLRLHHHDPRWVIMAVCCVATLLHFANGSRRSTHLGKIQRELIIRESRLRLKQSGQPAMDGSPSTYDLLWKMSDQVLLDGFRALGSTVFVKPLTTRAEDSKTTVL